MVLKALIFLLASFSLQWIQQGNAQITTSSNMESMTSKLLPSSSSSSLEAQGASSVTSTMSQLKTSTLNLQVAPTSSTQTKVSSTSISSANPSPRTSSTANIGPPTTSSITPTLPTSILTESSQKTSKVSSTLPSTTGTSIGGQATPAITTTMTTTTAKAENTSPTSITMASSTSLNVSPASSSPSPSSSMSPTASSSVVTPGGKKVTKSYTFSFKIQNYTCSLAIKENQVDTDVYKSLVGKIIAAVGQAYSGDASYKSAKVTRFDCGSVIPVVEVTKSATTLGTKDAELDLVKKAISTKTFAGFTVDTFSSNPAAATVSLPGLYIVLETGLSNKQLCASRENFREALSLIIVNANGESLIHKDQVVFAEHHCNDASASSKKASPKIFIAPTAFDANTVDTEVTTRLSLLIDQFISDGTTWRLGAAFANKVVSSKLGGVNKQTDDKLSEIERIGIGIGVTFAVLLLIIVIIMIVSRKKKDTTGAITMGNLAYLDHEISYAADNTGYEKETKLNIGDHDYEYPAAPANGKAHHADKETYQELQQTQPQQQQSPTYEPLATASEKEVRVKIEPDDGPTHVVTVDGLSQRKDNDNEMKREFQELDFDLPSSDLYPKAALEKNRVSKILPRPKTRVVLSSSDSDYINANFVKGYYEKNRYILTQGPMEKTAEDFWKMVDQQKIRVIMMATPLVQLGVEKCFQYWPAGGTAKKYGDIEVQLKKKELKPDFTITTMSLTSKVETREIVLYRYMTWPEDNVPESVKTFVTFLLEAKKAAGSDQMVVVHCSDGVGMSASLAAIDIGIQSLEDKRSVDVYNIVKAVRKDRAGAVQVFGQYKFIYQALHEYAMMNENVYANAEDEVSSM